MESSGAPGPAPFDALVDLLRGRRVVVLAGAGCSTESGIPDYRGAEGVRRVRKPMQYQEFVRSEGGRARYWARSAFGWPRFEAARPNAGHGALARLEAAGLVRGIITQNVDGLHQRAGSRRVVELHGTLSRVRCLACGEGVARSEVQGQILALNPGWLDGVRLEVDLAPDGDAELPRWAEEEFRVPACESCGGVLKPDVVFFGENVPAGWLEEAWQLFTGAEVLLVVGSSLTVYSGRRFIYRAEKEGVPIAIVNLGPTRGDDVAVAKVEGRVGVVLPRVVERLV